MWLYSLFDIIVIINHFQTLFSFQNVFVHIYTRLHLIRDGYDIFQLPCENNKPVNCKNNLVKQIVYDPILTKSIRFDLFA